MPIPTFLLNWLIALAVVLLLFAGLYFVVKLAVRKAVREALTELGQDLAKKLWAEDKTSDEDKTCAEKE